MRRLSTSVALAGIAAGILIGIGTPAGAVSESRSATTASASGWWRFGTYYTMSACQYFGESLRQSGQFGSYQCVSRYDSYYHETYWDLYVYQIY